MNKSDSYLVGILPEFNFRFLLTDCSNSVQEVITRHEMKYSSAILVGKTMLASFFLAGLVKEETTISIQLEGEGDIERVMAYSDRIGRMRGMAKHNAIQAEVSDHTLGIGKGIFRVTRWGGVQKLHQSITKLDDSAFETNLLNYINESDQLISFLSIYLDMDTKPIRACGMILQALPFTTSRQIDDLMDKISNMNIEQSKIFAGSIDESLKLMENMLETKADVLETGIPEFYCGCSLDKIKGVIASIGKEEAFSILEERGSIEMICEFCMEKYTLDAEEVKLLFI
ncbi:MAG TPA: Hsp33 family molecular chaperone HslO [Leptospiraceae bacterium]|nr:Hsp33 family molecular chaperone HslO [Leptospiraceae bacterium]HMW04269.1 Hsp33 family molecular chaperone HslO [Leptospiraceae bacterium]HMX30615.1 Hsp33 family molecular chaperone HslO [Leptospiraceae bacterium]HMY31315.1 Hsp33 family molecular chaperone HslO [Leptospiraceae bacterium]HMZ63428.1 Hsp33 family molecular chaperone HslO [Leptospiraceae bacterium]